MPVALERRIANPLKVWNGTGPLSVVPGFDLHGWRNPGPDAAQYFVISLGGDKA
jgi:hypothetical protein